MRIKPIHLIIFIFIVFSLFSNLNTFESIENKLQDSLLQSKKEIDTRIIIIAIDDYSLGNLGKWPWARSVHGQLLDTVSQGNPAVIGVDIMFSEDDQNPEEAEALQQAMERAGNVVLPVYATFDRKTRAGEMIGKSLVEPIKLLKAVTTTGHINTFPDPDGIVRKTILNYSYNDEIIKSFAWMIFEKYTKKMGMDADFEKIPLDQWNRMYIDYTGEPSDFEYLSYDKVLMGEIPPEYFEDKIVLIGPYTVGIDDYYFTPLAHESPMYGVEIHANIIQNLLYGNYKQYVPFVINLTGLLLLSLIGWYTFNKFSPLKSLLILAAVISLYLFTVLRLYKVGYIAAIFYPIILLIIDYLISLVYRYIAEMLERRRVTDVFGRYVAPQVVSQILKDGESGLKLGGTRREITALFVDIRGFTPLSEKCQPEEVVAILNDYLNLCAQSIFQFEGTLDKFIGDATMAIFNAPLDLEDHAFKAVQTAWAMKVGSVELQERLEEKFGRSVQFGIGINTGAAVVGNIGASFRMDYTAIGDTVNTAARLESNAKPGQILMSQSTYDRVKDRVEAVYLGEISVKGKTQGVSIYQLEGMR